jgi:hypothetical protein
MMAKRSPLYDRLFSKCVWDENGCFLFTGWLNPQGYGQIGDGKGGNIYAHRAAYLLCIGDIPEGLGVLHKRHCPNRNCCNPEHLYVGTDQDNTDDRMAMGRHVPPKGETNGGARLTEAQVQEARRMILHGVSCSEIGRRYGVTKEAIYAIKHRRSWAHLRWPDPAERPNLEPKPTVTINRRGL